MNASVDEGFDVEYPTQQRGPAFVEAESRFDIDRIMASIRNFASFSEALRVLGAGVLLASMSLFLLQGWNDGNDVSRYLMLLTQTGLLAAAGFALSHGLKEAKGARVFFGLALVSIPANFTILGALLYSVLQWDGGLVAYPGFATWQVDSGASIALTLAGAMVVLLPVAAFCFAIMARHSAKTLSLHFFVLNLMLLLPIRDSVAAGTIALLGILYATYVVRAASGKDRALKTPEGRFALATLFIPAGIVLFRSMYFYQIDSLMIAMLSLAGFLAARQASMLPDQSARVVRWLEGLSLPLAATFALTITDTFSNPSWSLMAPMFAVIYSALALDVLRRTHSLRLGKGIGFSICFFTTACFTWAVVIDPDAFAAMLCIAAGGLMLLAGVMLRYRTAAAAGSLTIVAGALFGYETLLVFVFNSSWIDLAVFGAGAIALGSVLDRHGVAMKLRFVKWFDTISTRQQAVALDD